MSDEKSTPKKSTTSTSAGKSTTTKKRKAAPVVKEEKKMSLVKVISLLGKGNAVKRWAIMNYSESEVRTVKAWLNILEEQTIVSAEESADFVKKFKF